MEVIQVQSRNSRRKEREQEKRDKTNTLLAWTALIVAVLDYLKG